MAEYIEREAIAKHIDQSFGEVSTPLVVREIRNFPTVDVVEVVRCKDCRHAREMNHREKQLYLEGCVMCSQVDINGEQNPMLPDDFCSYGERRR